MELLAEFKNVDISMRSAFMEYIPCHVWIFNMFLASWTWNCWQSSRMLTLVCGVHIPCLHNLATTNHPCRPQRLNLWPLEQEIFVFWIFENKSRWVKVNQKIQNYCKSYTLCSTARAQGLFFVAFSCQRECLDPSETVAPYRSKPPPFTDPNSRKKSDDRKTGQGSQKKSLPYIWCTTSTTTWGNSNASVLTQLELDLSLQGWTSQ